MRKFFNTDLINAIMKVGGLPGQSSTVSLGLPSTGKTADAVTTLKPSNALPGVAPPVRPVFALKQNA